MCRAVPGKGPTRPDPTAPQGSIERVRHVQRFFDEHRENVPCLPFTSLRAMRRGPCLRRRTKAAERCPSGAGCAPRTPEFAWPWRSEAGRPPLPTAGSSRPVVAMWTCTRSARPAGASVLPTAPGATAPVRSPRTAPASRRRSLNTHATSHVPCCSGEPTPIIAGPHPDGKRSARQVRNDGPRRRRRCRASPGLPATVRGPSGHACILRMDAGGRAVRTFLRLHFLRLSVRLPPGLRRPDRPWHRGQVRGGTRRARARRRRKPGCGLSGRWRGAILADPAPQAGS
jgi:hypothetical protein